MCDGCQLDLPRRVLQEVLFFVFGVDHFKGSVTAFVLLLLFSVLVLASEGMWDLSSRSKLNPCPQHWKAESQWLDCQRPLNLLVLNCSFTIYTTISLYFNHIPETNIICHYELIFKKREKRVATTKGHRTIQWPSQALGQASCLPG